jgi:hypothetical protein
MNMRDVLNTEQSTSMPDLRVRMGINLGPVKLLKDINNQVNLIGDGINVAQRIMSFAEAGQLLVSRSYYDIVSCLSQEYAQLFQYQGARADKHIREHDIYAVGHTGLRSVPSHHHLEKKASPAIADDKIIATGETQLKNIPDSSKTVNSKPDQIWINKNIMVIVVPIIAFIVVAMFVFIPPTKDKLTFEKKSSKASRAADKGTESKKSWWESNSEFNKEKLSTGSVKAEGIEFIYADIRSADTEVTLSINIRNSSGVVKSVALYDNYTTWPKSKLIDQAGKPYVVTNVIFFKGSQKITSKASGAQ